MTSEEQKEYNENSLSDEFKDEYTFDDYNNILKTVHTENNSVKNTVTTNSYDKTRLVAKAQVNGENSQLSDISYTYDDNGNLSGKTYTVGEESAQTVYTYDTFDRTESITIGGVTTVFNYNTDSDRVSKTTNGKTTESILDNGSVSADLIGDELKVYTRDNSVYYYNGKFEYNIINANGDLIASAGSNGIDYKYNAYGKKLSENNSANPIGYRNYYFDTETGLYYLKARYYDSTTENNVQSTFYI